MDALPHNSKGHVGAATGIFPDPQWDDNNFLRNPVWRWAKAENGQIPDLCGFCPCDSDQPADWNRMLTCTTQSVFSDSSFWCGYHMNWFPVEYEGFLEWGGKSPWYDDEDYFLAIHRDRGSINDHALETTARPGVHIEFDSRETVDHFDDTNTWWDGFHHNSVDNSDDAARQAINDKFAMVIGLLGIDSQHDAHSEIHPVYGMFVKLPGSQANQDRWGFFVRNFGNEGFCGTDDPIPNNQILVRIPGLSSIAALNRGVLAGENVWQFSDNDIDQCADTQWSHEATPDGGLLLTFNLSDPGKKCGFVGDLTIDWQGPTREPSGPAVGPVREPSALPRAPMIAARRSVGVSGEQETENPALSARIARLRPVDRQELSRQVTALMAKPAGKPSVRRKGPSNPLPHVAPPRVEAALPNYGKNLKPVRDPAAQAREAKKRQLIDAFLKAHGVQ
jgi:hypothetical protein